VRLLFELAYTIVPNTIHFLGK